MASHRAVTGLTERLLILPSDDVEPQMLTELTELCEAAFGEPFADAWHAVGPGIHVIATSAGRVAAHAMVVDRQVYLGHEPSEALEVGYVEHVATRPEVQRRGYASRVMREVNGLIAEEYALGALSTGSAAFYARLGWERWGGPTYVLTRDGQRARSVDHDGSVMVLRTPRTPLGLSLDDEIAIEWRDGEPW